MIGKCPEVCIFNKAKLLESGIYNFFHSMKEQISWSNNICRYVKKALRPSKRPRKVTIYCTKGDQRQRRRKPATLRKGTLLSWRDKVGIYGVSQLMASKFSVFGFTLCQAPNVIIIKNWSSWEIQAGKTFTREYCFGCLMWTKIH